MPGTLNRDQESSRWSSSPSTYPFLRTGEPFVPVSRSPADALGLRSVALDEIFPGWICRPLTFGVEDSVVVWCQPDDVDLFFSVPPATDLGVRVERAASNSLPDGFLAHVFERGFD
jgi:hypothetical protein